MTYCQVVLLFVAALFSCKARELGSSAQEVAAASASVDLSVVRDYHSTISQFLGDPKVQQGWDWFMYKSHGFDATPMVLIKMLPEIDPDIWGKPDEKFSRFGHFVLPGDENRVLPSSFGMTEFPTAAKQPAIIVTTETCGTCHMGRIRLPGTGGNDVVALFGGVNTQFDIRLWHKAMDQTVIKHLRTKPALNIAAARLREMIAKKPDGFFHPDPIVDARQRAFFLANGGTEKYLTEFVAFSDGFVAGKKVQRATSYAHANSPDVDQGHPGQVDASGDLLAQRLPTRIGMPQVASLTDIPSVWQQKEYSVGQWDGSLTNQFIRNLAAQVAVAPGPTIDRRVAHFALQFATDLPAPKFPFVSSAPDKQSALIAKGKDLYAANCAACHAPLNDKTYFEVETDPNRARILTKLGGLLIGKIFLEACAAKLPDGSETPSCGPNFTRHIRGSNPAGPAYAPKTLTGIWARAPYLHNGSVPTLRHLLVPSLRPTQFVLGSLSYDPVNVGYQWNINELDALRQADSQIGIMDTTQDGLSNKGHDQVALRVAGQTYRLNWTPRAGDDPEAVDALLEYLKTL